MHIARVEQCADVEQFMGRKCWQTAPDPLLTLVKCCDARMHILQQLLGNRNDKQC